MAAEELEPKPSSAKLEGRLSRTFVRAITFAVLGVGAVATCGIVLARLQQPLPVKPVSAGGGEKTLTKELKELAGKHFRNWPADRAPDLVIVLTGEQHNYEAPCGCSSPQLGGLERRYNFLKLLRDQGLEVVAADLGDVYFKNMPAGRRNTIAWLNTPSRLSGNLMKYSAVGVGVQEFRTGRWMHSRPPSGRKTAFDPRRELERREVTTPT